MDYVEFTSSDDALTKGQNRDKTQWGVVILSKRRYFSIFDELVV